MRGRRWIGDGWIDIDTWRTSLLEWTILKLLLESNFDATRIFSKFKTYARSLKQQNCDIEWEMMEEMLDIDRVLLRHSNVVSLQVEMYCTDFFANHPYDRGHTAFGQKIASYWLLNTAVGNCCRTLARLWMPEQWSKSKSWKVEHQVSIVLKLFHENSGTN